MARNSSIGRIPDHARGGALSLSHRGGIHLMLGRWNPIPKSFVRRRPRRTAYAAPTCWSGRGPTTRESPLWHPTGSSPPAIRLPRRLHPPDASCPGSQPAGMPPSVMRSQLARRIFLARPARCRSPKSGRDSRAPRIRAQATFGSFHQQAPGATGTRLRVARRSRIVQTSSQGSRRPADHPRRHSTGPRPLALPVCRADVPSYPTPR